MIKKALTIEEQIDRLAKVHGLTVNDNNKAKTILSIVNYYALRGYGEYCGLIDLSTIKHDPETGKKLESEYKYKIGTTIEDVYNLYLFDVELKSWFLSLLSFVEKNIRVKLSISISTYEKYNPKTKKRERLGGECYFDEIIYASEKAFKAQRKELKRKIKLIKKHVDDSVIKHHVMNHNGKFPIWVLIEYLDLGNVEYLFTSLKNNIKNKLLISLGFEKYDDFIKFIVLVRKLRNKCAHFNRVYGQKIYFNPTTDDPLFKGKGNKTNQGVYIDLFSILLMCKQHLETIDACDEWNTLINRLDAIVSGFKNVDLKYIGCPLDWKSRLMMFKK